MKIALVHDHLAQDGGAEIVLRAFAEIWPEAPIFVLVHNPEQANAFFAQRDIRTSFIQRMPLGLRKYQWFFPLMPAAMEDFDLSGYDVVLSSSSSFAKGIVTRPGTMHINYCHTPTRFLWSDTHSYVDELGVNRVVKKIIPLFLSHIRMWDRLAAERADAMIANSTTVAKRIVKYYHRESTVIYPPVNTKDFTVAEPSAVREYFLAGGRLVPYKRFDLLVEAFNKLNRPLKIFGNGPECAELKRQAHSNIEFVGRVSDAELKKLYAECTAFLNPQEEDFGITMIEAMAAGRPVIAYSKGGAAEIIEHGKTGLLIDYQTWEDFADAVIGFDHTQFDPKHIRKRAQDFEHEVFKAQIRTFVEKEWHTFQKNY
ncbi:MAG: glycosyltransferase [Candidatus Kerfeldbacteria bacterium]|nr:glycosyltransferase [Candidatus Kerfeldbacteria bacterium]